MGSPHSFLGDADKLDAETAEKSRSEELAAKRNRFLVGFAVSLPLMAIMLADVDLGIDRAYFMLAVSLLPFVYVSQPIFSAATRSLISRRLDMDVMYAMGIGVAFSAHSKLC